MKHQWLVYANISILIGLFSPPMVSATELADAPQKIHLLQKSQFCTTSGTPGEMTFYFRPRSDRLTMIEKQASQLLKEGSSSSIQQSVVLLQEALQLIRTSPDRSPWEGEALFQLGEANFALGSFPTALEYYQSALPWITRFEGFDWNGSRQVAILHGIGKTYRALGRSRQALNSHLQALDLVKKYRGIGSCLREAIAYKYIGEIYTDTGNVEQALIYFQGALEFRSSYLHPLDLDPVGIFNNSGKIHFELGDRKLALEFFEGSFQTADRLNRSASITFKRIKADSKNPHSSDQYMLKGVQSELEFGIKQLDATIAILTQLQPKLENNPEMQSRYAAKLRDCQTLKAEMTIALQDLKKSYPSIF